MQIRIAEIPGDGLDVIATRGKAWFSRVLEGVDPYPLESWRLADAELFLRAEGADVFVEGSYEAVGEGRCDLCTEPVSMTMSDRFATVFVPPDEKPAGNANVELHGADLEINFHDGVSVDPESILREQVALGLPSRVLCGDGCKGLCPRCGGNRNRGECACPADRSEGAFSVLESLKKKKE